MKALAIASILMAGFAAGCAQPPAKPNGAGSTLITNARIVDGSGKPAFAGSVRIQGQRIVAVGTIRPIAGERVVDASGLVLSPGFIDTHSHHDRGLFDHPDALAAVSQGITTIVVGQDGSMEFPVDELFYRMGKTPPALNVASYVGHNTLRELAMGQKYQRLATAEETERMKEMVRQGMEAGALGLSTGLEYDPGIYSSTGGSDRARAGGGQLRRTLHQPHPQRGPARMGSAR